MKTFLYLTLLLFTSFIFISCGSDRSGENYYSFNDSDSIYWDGEDGTIGNWQLWQGHPIENVAKGANGSKRSILLREDWIGEDGDDYESYINGASYHLPIQNDYQTILEFDKMKKRGEKINHCFIVGVKTITEYGERWISFNTFYDLRKIDASSQWFDTENGSVLEFVFPLSMNEYVTQDSVWKHLRFDLNSYLQQFEPDNKILSIESFYFEGGDDYLDNIRLVSQ